MKCRVCVYEKDGMILDEVIGTDMSFAVAEQVKTGVDINIGKDYICCVEEDK